MNFSTSTLQLGLLAIGFVLVIAVYVYNVVQERRIRKRMDDAFGVTEDPLLSSSTRSTTDGSRDGGETREGRDGRDGRDPREARESREREPREARESREPRERIEPRFSSGDGPGSGGSGSASGSGGSGSASGSGGSGGPGGSSAGPVGTRGTHSDFGHDFPESRAAFNDEPLPESTVAPPPVSSYAPAEPDEHGSAPLANEPASELPDPDIECVARLQGVSPIAGGALTESLSHPYAKPTRWVGRQTTGVWSIVREGQTYTEIAACMVLADRDGPMTEAGYTDFRETIEELGQALPAAFIIGERADEVHRATELDAFCADVDIQIGLNLLRKDGGRWTGTRLRGVAEASGFKLNGIGQFDYFSEETGILLFRLQNREKHPLLAESMKLVATTGVTILLDVPRVAEPVKAYDQMRALVRRLAVTLDAEVVDDNGRPLTDAGLTQIRTQLQSVQATMRAKGIEPGSPRALRLFN